MKLIILAIVLTFVAYASSAEGNEWVWGVIKPDDDYLIADDKVSKRSWLFSIPEKEYVFKQKKDDRLTISGIIISDPKGKCKATVTLVKGGPGKTTATLKFVGKRNQKFKCYIKIYGYQ